MRWFRPREAWGGGGQGGGGHVGGGRVWRVEAEMSPVVRGLLGIAVDPIELLPDFLRPPGY